VSDPLHQFALRLLFFFPLLHPAAIALSFRPRPSCPIHVVGLRLDCGGLQWIVKSHITPEDFDAEAGIVAVSEIGGPMAKVSHNDDCKFCLVMARGTLRVHPGIITSARGWRSWDGLSREVLPFEPSD
jgi:hypothetical protein